MTLRDHAIRYGFIVLLFGLIAYFAIAADGFVSPQSAVFIFQSVAITGVLALGVTATIVLRRNQAKMNRPDPPEPPEAVG